MTDEERALRDLRNDIRAAIADGKVSFPDGARECFPIEVVSPVKREFVYLEAEPIRQGIHFRWGIKGIGFGELDVFMKDGEWLADTETMGQKFLRDLLIEWSARIKIRE